MALALAPARAHGQRLPWLEDVDLDELAAQRYLVKDGFAGGALALAARVEALALPSHPGGLSRATTHHHDGVSRGDDTAWLTLAMTEDGPVPMPALALLWSRFDALRMQLNRGAYLGLERFELQAAHYPGAGPGYVRHRDAFLGGAQPNRRMTAILYLNPDWSPACGGRLRLHPVERAPEDIDPVLDRLVLFPSAELDHEVLPTHASRLALTAWYYGRA